jgi:eukaryotic-like serine/threonine-protein kinase
VGTSRVLEPLGRGGIAEVYRAYDERLGREVAVKVVGGARIDDDRLRRFGVEARALRRIEHPGIVDIYDHGVVDGVPYLVLELLKGETLRQRLDRRALRMCEVLDVAEQVTSALQIVHERGIVHRDLKPGNLFCMADGTVKILDFGLAKLIADRSFEQSTFEGAVLGTPDYMAPEQVNGTKIDRRTDLFTLAIVLYEMMSGRKPFHRSAPILTMYAIATGEPDPFDGVDPRIAGDIEAVLLRAMKKEPKDRFPDAASMMDALRTCLREMVN